MLHLTFLGTSAGVPTKYRNVTGLALQCINPFKSANKQAKKAKQPWVLVDCGEATQQQILKTKLSLIHLEAICITHIHGDHCYGLPGLLASMAMSGRTRTLTILAPQKISQFIEALIQCTDLYLPYPLDFIAIESLLATSLNRETVKPKNMSADSINSENISQESTSQESTSQESTSQESTSQEKVNTEKSWLNINSINPIISLNNQSEHDDSTKLTLNFSSSHQLHIGITALSHRVPSYAFTFTQTVKTTKLDTQKLLADNIEPKSLWGRLQQGEEVSLADGRVIKPDDYSNSINQQIKVVVAGDNDQPQLLQNAVNGTQLLVHEATYTQAVADKIKAREQDFDPMHTTAQSIARFAEAVNLENLILTHFSARYQPFDDESAKIANMADIRQEVESLYKGRLWLAEDFAEFVVTEQETKKLIIKSANHK